MTQPTPTPTWRLQTAVVADLELRIAKGASFRYGGSGPSLLGTLKPYHDDAAIAAGVPRGEANLRLVLADGRRVYIEVMAIGMSCRARRRRSMTTSDGTALLCMLFGLRPRMRRWRLSARS